ncbi:aconitate hydratase AcnA [Amycolatopsis sp. 195334CR]|uniref:aconitate hydratase AcnA n=1 Tax=Amycolatopsis sp. 195334CR TaxID=2814588 RepID=UPI001A8CC913|nr:aconitate hydratase AcnA [Amycolatopsis sp. 195334CR]MBN6038252.1 aconitate hydratase AcnA [Amycolatopsis sp. 195334CR]
MSTLVVGSERFRFHRITGLAPAELPYTLRIVLENLLRHGKDEQVEALLRWGAPDVHENAVDLHPARIFLHDTNGVPVLADIAAMRHAMAGLGGDPARVNPAIPAELVIDHSVIADFFGRPDALARNVEIEYGRNAERYRFLKWGQQNLENFAVVPPGTGIMHQVNLEHLARVVVTEDGWAYPDVCLGTDSHTTMVNGLGVLGWGIGGIEAEAAMLGQSLSMLVPPVVGVRLRGALPEGTTATDLVLTITELMRAHGVVGKFVEFSGPGVAAIGLADRATIANMSPEFGSTCAYFPIDEETLRYLRFSGRSPERVALVEAYAKEQGLWHEPDRTPAYSETIDLDLGTVVPSLAGPRRPQDRVRVDQVKDSFRRDLGAPPGEAVPVVLDGREHRLGHGAVAIAAITSCTNTSNPAVMVAAGLLARNAVEAGLRSKPWVKTSLSPGSRVVTEYLREAGLTPYLDELGFHLTGFGCMTCIGASGPLIDEVTAAVDEHGLAVAAVLSGNRNFDGRVNPDVRLNYLASPPLVVAYALAGTMDLDPLTEPLGTGPQGDPVYLRDIWPSSAQIREVVDGSLRREMFTEVYRDVFAGDERWRALDAPAGETFSWDEDSTYLRRPPYLDAMSAEPAPVEDVLGARVLVRLGDSVTTDHVSPAGAIPPGTPAGEHLTGLGVTRFELNTYASRRGNHEVMMRGCFANVRLRNQLVPGREGGSALAPDGTVTSVYDAALAHRGTPLIVLARRDYGTGSSRDWAAKGPALLGVRVVLAESFERIHRSNLIGMGVLPLQFTAGESAESLGLTGHETFDIRGLAGAEPGHYPKTVTIDADGCVFEAIVRLDTVREQEYHRHGGILPFVLRDLLTAEGNSRR